MSTIQVSNVVFESTTNNQIYLSGSNSVTLQVGGLNSVVVNTSTAAILSNTTIGGTVTVNGAVLTTAMNLNYQNNSPSYVITATDSGSVIWLGNNTSSSIPVTVPNTLPAGFRTMITKVTPNTVIISGGTGVTLFSRTGAFTITQEYGSASIFMGNSTFGIVDGNI